MISIYDLGRDIIDEIINLLDYQTLKSLRITSKKINNRISKIKMKALYIQERKGINSSLVWAALGNHLEIIQYLIRKGADIHYDNDYVLHRASEYGYLEMVELLIKNGADINSWGNCAVRMAAEQGHLKIVELLVEQGADVFDNYLKEPCCISFRQFRLNPRSAFGLAVGNNHSKIVEYLTEKESNKQVKTNYF